VGEAEGIERSRPFGGSVLLGIDCLKAINLSCEPDRPTADVHIQWQSACRQLIELQAETSQVDGIGDIDSYGT
jgi:hypothetical protein